MKLDTFSLKIRIPSKKFDEITQNLRENFGTILLKTIHIEDVTEEFVDVNIRLKNKLAYLNQYQQILQKATSIVDILEVQEKIRALEEEIESKKGRILFLDDQVLFSTLHLELVTMDSSQYTNSPNFERRVQKAFKDGITGSIDFVIAIIRLWPVWLVITSLAFTFRYLLKRWRNTKV